MTFNRALSMLARQLFPDVIVDCYAEGEIRDAPALDTIGTVVSGCISEEECKKLHELLTHDNDPAEASNVIMKRLKVDSLDEIRVDRFQPIMTWLGERISNQKATEATEVEAEVVVVKKEASVFDETPKM
jgi:hypothetical protein